MNLKERQAIRERVKAAISPEGIRQFPITEVDEQGGILPCNVCGKPAPGMSHRCTEFLFKDIIDLLDELEEAIGLLGEHRAWPSRYEVNERIEAFLNKPGARHE